jgi:hypothetical protein
MVRKTDMNRTQTPELDLTSDYAPAAVYYDDADSLEYVRCDEPCVYRRIDELLTLVLSLHTRTPVGFRIKGFKHFYLEFVKNKTAEKSTEFPMLISIIEDAAQKIGNQIFEHSSIREAYAQARTIAEEDKVRLNEVPKVA